MESISLPTAIVAGFPVNADQMAAAGAFPAGLFPFCEFSNACIPDVFEVFDHAHAIFGSVAFIQLFESGAGIGWAGETEPSASRELFAVLDSTSDAACGLVFVTPPASGASVLFPYIGITDTAVHTAGSDQGRFDCHAGYSALCIIWA